MKATEETPNSDEWLDRMIVYLYDETPLTGDARVDFELAARAMAAEMRKLYEPALARATTRE
jgi:hypothetical protein